MPKGVYNIPYPVNEEVKSYAPGTVERDELIAKYQEMFNQSPIDVPMYIGADQVRTENKKPMSPPHNHQKVLGHFNYGDKTHVEKAISAALAAKDKWASLPWEQIGRAHV